MQPETATTVDDVQKAVCEYFGIRMSDLKGKKRNRSVTFPRMIAMYICRERLQESFPSIGDRFGGRDHSTVMHAVRKMANRIAEDDAEVLGPIDAVERKLGI